jgi:hypothetical protein
MACGNQVLIEGTKAITSRQRNSRLR